MLILSLLFLLSYSLNLMQADNKNLQNLFILWRHGDRAPYGNILDLKEGFDKLWPMGQGQLTDLGITQQYALGEFLREKYGNFIPQNYSFLHYHIRSSDYDRTLMSAQANLAAFFKESYSPLTMINPGSFNWRPIPVHTVQKSREALFSNEPCKRLKELTQKDFDSDEGKDVINKFQIQIDHAEKHLGKKLSVQDLETIHDEIVCLQAHNYSLPSWLSPNITNAFTQISNHFWHTRMQGRERLSFEVGVFLHNMFAHMIDLIMNGNASVNVDGKPVQLAKNHIMAYSAHDTNVSPLLTAFGMEQKGMPGYTACIMIELIGPGLPGLMKDFKIRIWYKNSFIDKNATPMKFDAYCKGETECAFETALAEMSQYFIKTSEYKQRCDASYFYNRHSSLTLVFIVFGLTALIMVSIYLYRSLSRRRNYNLLNDQKS